MLNFPGLANRRYLGLGIALGNLANFLDREFGVYPWRRYYGPVQYAFLEIESDVYLRRLRSLAHNLLGAYSHIEIHSGPSWLAWRGIDVFIRMRGKGQEDDGSWNCFRYAQPAEGKVVHLMILFGVMVFVDLTQLEGL